MTMFWGGGINTKSTFESANLGKYPIMIHLFSFGFPIIILSKNECFEVTSFIQHRTHTHTHEVSGDIACPIEIQEEASSACPTHLFSPENSHRIEKSA